MRPNLATKYLSILVCLFFCSVKSGAQCPDIYDGTGTPSPNPYWISCFGTNFDLIFQSPDNIGAYTIDWGDGSAISSGGSLIPPASVTHTYTSTVDTFIVTLTETGTGCVVTGVVVMEEPSNASIQIPLGGSTQACAPQILEFTNSSTDVSETTVFTWDFGDGSPIVVQDYTTAGQVIQHQYLPGTVNCNTAVTLTAENYCNAQQGGPSQATFNPVQVWDFDIAAVQASALLLCYPDTTVTFENITTRNCLAEGNIFQRQELWNFGDYWGVGTDSIVGWQPWPPSLPVTIDFPGIGTYDIMLVDSNFCGLDTAIITIDIVAPPAAAFTVSDDTVCAGDVMTTFNGSGAGADSFDWNFGDGSGWQTTDATDQNHVFAAAGDYTIQLAANVTGGLGCTDTFTLDIHVLPSPTAVINISNASGCDTLTTVFTEASIDAITWDWDFGNGNTSISQTPPAQFYATSGNYTVSLTVNASNGCSSTATEPVDVFQSPVVNFTPTAVCENSVSQFFDQSTSLAGDPVITWDWDFGDGNTAVAQDPTNTYAATGTYDVILIASTANCSGTDTIPVTVEPLPTAGFTTTPLSGCTPLDVGFTNSSVGAASYLWLFGDGDTAVATDTSHTYINLTLTDTVFDAQLIAVTAFGCTDTAFAQIDVFSGTQAAFTHNGVAGCAPLDVTFVNNSTGGSSYEWDFGDGTTSTVTDPFHVYVNASLFLQTDTVQLVSFSPNGCTDTTEQYITLFPTPDFTYNIDADTGCSPLNVSFPTVVGAVVYDWDFGDGNTSGSPAPNHTFVNPGATNVTYTVELIATSAFGCVDTTYDSVLVYPKPVAQFQVNNMIGCHPYTATFDNLSIGGSTFNWDYDDGNTSTNAGTHTHTFINTGPGSAFFDVSLEAESANGCLDTSQMTIEVYPEVIADYSSDSAGCSPFTVDFTNLSSNADSYQWDFGDGIQDVGANPSHTYINNGTTVQVFTAELIAISADGCEDTITYDIEVYPFPVADFIANPLIQNFPATTVAVTNTSSTGPWDYLWNYGDDSTSNLANPVPHVYATWGVYDISLIVSTPYCSDTAFESIEILPASPIAHFSGSGVGCAPLTISFIDSSQHVHSWLWDFGDGNTSTEQNPTYTYFSEGTYTVTLSVIGDGGVDTAVHVDTVTAYPRATAFFQFFPDVVFVPNQPVQFYNLSVNADEYTWIYGDGVVDTVYFQPVHYYTEPGSYDVTLIATNEYGCADTMTLPNAVTGEVGGSISFPSAFTPNPLGSNGGVYDPQSTDNDIFFPVFFGVDDYHLMIFNRWGELIFESFDTSIGWDGLYRGEPCQQDVYVWKVNARFNDGTVFSDAGDLTLIR